MLLNQSVDMKLKVDIVPVDILQREEWSGDPA